MHQMFSIHTMPEKFEHTTISGHFGFMSEENMGGEITRLLRHHHFQKAPFPHKNAKPAFPNSIFSVFMMD